MKVVFCFALLAAATMAMKDEDMSMSMEEGPMMDISEEERAFLLRMAPILMKMKAKMMVTIPIFTFG